MTRPRPLRGKAAWDGAFFNTGRLRAAVSVDERVDRKSAAFQKLQGPAAGGADQLRTGPGDVVLIPLEDVAAVGAAIGLLKPG